MDMELFEPECRGDVCYRVSLTPRGLFDLVSIEGEAVDGKCYRVVCRRSEPCAECPLLADDPSRPRVLEPLEAKGPFRLVSALVDDTQEARVTVRHVPQEVVSELVHVRIHAKADEAGLSPREREVLDLLVLGHGNDAVAEALGITPRTVKFHQGRLLAKLGAESRLDLLRLFL